MVFVAAENDVVRAKGDVLHANIAACTCTCKRNALLSRVTYIAEQIKNVRRQQLAVVEAIPVVAL